METSTETPWLTDTQQQNWRAFLGANTLLMDRLDRELRANHDLSMPEYEVLVRLSESPGRSIRMAELAAALAHSRSRVTHTISRLEKDGFVKRSQSATDGRGVSALLTDKGFAALEAAAHTHVLGVHTYLVENATDEEFDVIGRVMKRICEQLDPTGTRAP